MRSILFISLLVSGFYTRAQHTDSVSVYFGSDKYILTGAAQAQLDKFIAGYRSGNIDSSITITGYCDSVGSLAYNDLLSRQRAFAVHNYLLNHGIDKRSVALLSGYGKRVSLNNNSTEEERQANRRVTISWKNREPEQEPVVEVPPPAKTTDTIRTFSKTAIDSVKQGEVLRLRNINFYGGRHTFLPQSMPALNELLDVMKSHPKLVIEIQGHICCRIGSSFDGADFDSGDDNLSVNRARAVYYYLAQNGIDKRRMTYKGFAALYPLINPELSEADRTLNRRVEIKIVSK
jgi:outer membrane protein OmpA-like peptidoglycan-associated protein